MKNVKYTALFFGVLLFVSCNKDKENLAENSNVEINDSIEQAVSDSTLILNSDLQTFNLPAEVQGCSCYFAKNKEDFDNEKYVYADDYGNTAYIKIEDKIVKIPMEEGDFDPSDFSKTISNKDFTITISGRKLKELDETMTFQGELTLEKKDGTKSVTPIYGECGC